MPHVGISLYSKFVILSKAKKNHTRRPLPAFLLWCMSGEILSQEEIDELIRRTQEIDPKIIHRLSHMVTPQMEATVKTMLKRYYYALTHGDVKEQRRAKDNLRKAAFKVWLYRNGFVNKFDYVRFINNEVKKRGLNWKLSVR